MRRRGVASRSVGPAPPGRAHVAPVVTRPASLRVGGAAALAQAFAAGSPGRAGGVLRRAAAAGAVAAGRRWRTC